MTYTTIDLKKKLIAHSNIEHSCSLVAWCRAAQLRKRERKRPTAGHWHLQMCSQQTGFHGSTRTVSVAFTRAARQYYKCCTKAWCQVFAGPIESQWFCWLERLMTVIWKGCWGQGTAYAMSHRMLGVLQWIIDVHSAKPHTVLLFQNIFTKKYQYSNFIVFLYIHIPSFTSRFFPKQLINSGISQATCIKSPQ